MIELRTLGVKPKERKNTSKLWSSHEEDMRDRVDDFVRTKDFELLRPRNVYANLVGTELSWLMYYSRHSFPTTAITMSNMRHRRQEMPDPYMLRVL